MSFRDALTAEIRFESAATRRFLERFPEEQAGFAPHDRSMNLAKLACHVVEIPNWSRVILEAPEFDFAQFEYVPLGLTKRADLLAKHEQVTDEALGVFSGVTDAATEEIWRFRSGEQVLAELPRSAAIRRFVMSHLIHHRAQLSVYYRLLGVPVPGAYGPSADDVQE